MTVEEASTMLYSEAQKQGIPLDREFCERMSRLLLLEGAWSLVSMSSPGDIARYHRERYGEDEAHDVYEVSGHE